MTVLTGPNGSTSCGSIAPARARSSTGDMKAPCSKRRLVGGAVHHLGGAAQRLDRLAHLVALGEADASGPIACSRRPDCRR